MNHPDYTQKRDWIIELIRRGDAFQRGSTVHAHANNLSREEAAKAIDALVLEREQALLEKIRKIVVKRGMPDNYYGEVWEWIEQGVKGEQ